MSADVWDSYWSFGFALSCVSHIDLLNTLFIIFFAFITIAIPEHPRVEVHHRLDHAGTKTDQHVANILDDLDSIMAKQKAQLTQQQALVRQLRKQLRGFMHPNQTAFGSSHAAPSARSHHRNSKYPHTVPAKMAKAETAAAGPCHM